MVDRLSDVTGIECTWEADVCSADGLQRLTVKCGSWLSVSTITYDDALQFGSGTTDYYAVDD